MTDRPEVYLDDIYESILLIEKYLQDVTEERFYKDQLLQDGVVRRFLIIGEAVKNMPSDIKTKYPEVKWKEIAGFRDVLIHAYGKVNPRRVWLVITDHLQVLKERVIAIRKGLGPKSKNGPEKKNGKNGRA